MSPCEDAPDRGTVEPATLTRGDIKRMGGGVFRPSQVLRLPAIAPDGSPDYTVREVIQGGMGVCARIEHRESGEILALKALRPDLAADETARERFAAEGRAWMLMSGLPGVLPARAVVRWNDFPLIVAEWMAGGDLRRRITAPDPETYFRVTIQIAAALDAAYSRHGVVHRDIKPSNVLFDETGRVFVADWGIAHGVGMISASPGALDPSPQRMTQMGAFLGTVAYAAPEQILDASSVDWRADLYALGCILYEWETGAPPFLGATVEEIARGHLHLRPPPLGGPTRRGRFHTAAIVQRSLEKRPADRHASYAAFLDDLEAAARSLGLDTRRPDPPPARPPPIRSSDGRFALVDASEPLGEAEALMGFGRYAEARQILAPYYIQSLLEPPVAWHMGHIVGLNLAMCLSELNRDQTEAIRVLRQLELARDKPVEFYLNYSLTLLRADDLSAAERVAREGRSRFPRDGELAGNLMSALVHQAKFAEAFAIAPERLDTGRDLAALLDVAVLHQSAARHVGEDWPAATHHLKTAFGLLTEAKRQNDRSARILYPRAQILRELFQFDEASKDAVTVFEVEGGRGFGEHAVALQMQLLWDTGSRDGALDFAEKWIPRLREPFARLRMERLKARILADTSMIGMEVGGERVVVPEVVSFYESQVQNSSHHPTPDDHIELARIYEWMGRAEEAFHLLDRCLERWPGHWRALMNRSHFLYRGGKVADSVTVALQAVDSAPYRPEPLDALASVYSWLGDQDRVRKAKERADQVFEERRRLAR